MKRIFKFSKHNKSICLEADKELFLQIKNEITPYINGVEVNKKGDEEWIIKIEEPYRGSDTSYEKINFNATNLDEPRRVYYVDKARKIIFLSKPVQKIWQKQICIRLIRDALRNLVNNGTTLFLHGALVVVENKGICILGEKRSGKTTSVLNLLSEQNSSFVSNDDISICFQDDRLIGVGWPRAVSTRKDSFDALRSIGISYDVKQSELTHPYNSKENKTSKDYYTFYPYELKELTKSELLESHPIDYILFTSFESKTRIIELENSEGIRKLLNNQEKDINKYFKEFAKYFSEGTTSKELQRRMKSINDVSFLRIEQEFNNLKKLKAIIHER